MTAKTKAAPVGAVEALGGTRTPGDGPGGGGTTLSAASAPGNIDPPGSDEFGQMPGEAAAALAAAPSSQFPVPSVPGIAEMRPVPWRWVIPKLKAKARIVLVDANGHLLFSTQEIWFAKELTALLATAPELLAVAEEAVASVEKLYPFHALDASGRADAEERLAAMRHVLGRARGEVEAAAPVPAAKAKGAPVGRPADAMTTFWTRVGPRGLGWHPTALLEHLGLASLEGLTGAELDAIATRLEGEAAAPGGTR